MKLVLRLTSFFKKNIPQKTWFLMESITIRGREKRPVLPFCFKHILLIKHLQITKTRFQYIQLNEDKLESELKAWSLLLFSSDPGHWQDSILLPSSKQRNSLVSSFIFTFLLSIMLIGLSKKVINAVVLYWHYQPIFLVKMVRVLPGTCNGSYVLYV